MLNQMLAFLLDTLLGLFSLALLLRFLMQLLRAPYRNPLSPFLIALTDFLVRPVRRLTLIAGFDTAPPYRVARLCGEWLRDRAVNNPVAY